MRNEISEIDRDWVEETQTSGSLIVDYEIWDDPDERGGFIIGGETIYLDPGVYKAGERAAFIVIDAKEDEPARFGDTIEEVIRTLDIDVQQDEVAIYFNACPR
jgi:hypothetical protein